MKKICISSLLAVGTLSLCSCTVNAFGDTAEVPWYAVVLPILAVFLLLYTLILRKTYICPHCNTEFRAKPHQLYVTVHMGGKRLARCPHCKRISFCRIKRPF